MRNNSSSKCTAHSTSTGNLADRLWKAEAAARAFDIREAEDEEYWDIADVHCHSFYPHIQQPAGFFLRLDRVMALHLGKVIEKNRKACHDLNSTPFATSCVACIS